jgi:hypothetical protein
MSKYPTDPPGRAGWLSLLVRWLSDHGERRHDDAAIDDDAVIDDDAAVDDDAAIDALERNSAIASLDHSSGCVGRPRRSLLVIFTSVGDLRFR